MAKIADRIKEGLSLRNMKQVDLVEKTGINKGALSSYISGSYEPKQKNIYKIAKALNVSEAWLMGFDVSMERIENVSCELSKDEFNLLSKFNFLDEKGKHTVNTVLDMEYNRCRNEISATAMVAESHDEYMPIAAHNDFSDDPEEQRLMQEDLDEL